MTSSMLLPVKPLSAQAAREVRRDTALRRARTCYGHLAGVTGVALMDGLLDRGWLEVVPAGPDARRLQYLPTALGIAALTARGIAVPVARSGKPVAFSCVDWTERRPHLGGALGRAIVEAMAQSGCIERTPESREVTLAGDLQLWLG
jgi:hypothetical protein